MKKFLIVVIVIALLIVGYAYDQFGWCKKLLFGSPTTHVIQKGEYLSEIAKKYYGRADYWRELALINRAPDSDLVFPGEEIIIPSLDIIKEIRRTRWLSKVNAYVKNEEDIIAGLNQGDEPVLAETEPKTTPEVMLDSEQQEITSAPGVADTPIETAQQSFESDQPEVRSASSLGLILAIIGVLFVGSLTALILIRRKKRSQQIRIVDNDEINILDDEETEPDYQEYLQKNKSQREEGVLAN
jgi:hypothetical protein